MREILFRGKRLDNGAWIEGFYFNKKNPASKDGVPVSHCISDLPPFGAEVDFETVGQYTGLNDKNGTKIFEGDVVKYHYLDGFSIREVIFDQYTAKFCLRDIYGCHNIYVPLLCEVLGNVHDNPELFKGGSSELKGGED